MNTMKQNHESYSSSKIAAAGVGRIAGADSGCDGGEDLLLSYREAQRASKIIDIFPGLLDCRLPDFYASLNCSAGFAISASFGVFRSNFKCL